MKGIVFSEFIDMVENRYSLEVADRIITSSQLESDGVYTSVGTYDHQELVELLQQLSQAVGEPVPDLLKAFGSYLFERFAQLYPAHFKGQDTAFDFLGTLEGKIHVEVKKLYPDAELPHFECTFPTTRSMVLIYRSKRSLGDLAEGLIYGCIRHFGQAIELNREDLPCDDGAHIRFTLKVLDDG